MKTIRGIFSLTGLLAMAACSLSIAEVNAQKISMDSPFLPRSGSGIGATTENTPVELRGILKDDTGPIFGLYDSVKKQGWWVKANEPSKDQPVTVKNYDAANDAVTVEYQGRVMNLALKTAKIEAAPAMAMSAPPRPMPMPGQPNIAPAPTADDTKRLEAVAAEVARRRQARQAAAQQGGQPGQAGQPAPAQPPQPVRTGNGIGGAR